VNLEETEINMVFFTWPSAAGRAKQFADAFRKHGILVNPPDENGNFRFVTHYWIGDGETEKIIAACMKIFTPEK
jgi:threonine aldolase